MGERIGFLGIGKVGDRLAVRGPLRRHPGIRNRLPSTKYDWGAEGPPPDRIYLEKVLLPKLAKEGPYMLSVGVANYTQGYRRIVDNERRGIQYITTDAGVDKNERGVPDFRLNVTNPQFPAQIREALQQDQTFSFDSIVLNGIIGWGTNTEAETERMLQNCHELLKNGGKLLLGWNSPEFPTHFPIEDEDLVRIVSANGFTVREIDGREVYHGPFNVPWSPKNHSEYQFHRYVMAEKTEEPSGETLVSF